MLLYLHIMDSFIDLSILGSNYANVSHVPLAELLNSWRSRRRFCWNCSLLGVFHWLFKRLLPLSEVTHLRTASSKEGVWWVTTSASRHKHLVAESAKNTTDSCVEPDEIDSIRILRLTLRLRQKDRGRHWQRVKMSHQRTSVLGMNGALSLGTLEKLRIKFRQIFRRKSRNICVPAAVIETDFLPGADETSAPAGGTDNKDALWTTGWCLFYSKLSLIFITISI